METDGDDLCGPDVIDGLERLRRYVQTGDPLELTFAAEIVKLSGRRVRTVDRGSGWTAGERAMYGGRWGKVETINFYCGPRYVEMLIRLESGPCQGEGRWFRPAEIAEVDRCNG